MADTKIKRNTTVDVLRGIAMLLVVLGHTMTGCTEGSQDSFLFQVIWSLQMPLFILISGYVTRYSKTINTISDLGKILWKRTAAYLIPWCFWSFLVRGLIFQQSNYLNIKWLLWHMDSGYWFLFALWTIVVIFSISHFIANKMCKENIKAAFLIKTIAYICGMGVLVGIGIVFGMAFLAIKLTLYYMPFYYAGHIYGVVQDKILALTKGRCAIKIISALCLAFWLVIITRVNLYYSEDGGMALIIRAIASILGCVAICSLIGSNDYSSNNDFLKPKIVFRSFFIWSGNNSLQIYLLHGFFLNLLTMQNKPMFSNAEGIVLVSLNYLATLSLLWVVINLLKNNGALLRILFWKK